MAISLNEGSFGLLMDPLNGAADIEARTLRLVSNYGFLEEPSLLIRATRYLARLGWELDPRTQHPLRECQGGERDRVPLRRTTRSQELEQIGHEDDGLKVLRALEAEGWMKVLFPAWTAAKADEEKLKALHDLARRTADAGRSPRHVGGADAVADRQAGAQGSVRSEEADAAAGLCRGVEQPGLAGCRLRQGAAGQGQRRRLRQAYKLFTTL